MRCFRGKGLKMRIERRLGEGRMRKGARGEAGGEGGGGGGQWVEIAYYSLSREVKKLLETEELAEVI